LGHDQICVVGLRYTIFDKSFLPKENQLIVPEDKINENFRRIIDGEDASSLCLSVWNTPHDLGFLKLAEISGVEFHRNP
jgi:hypothetical protein